MQNLKLLIGVIGGTLALVFAVAFLFSSQPSSGETRTYDPVLVVGDARNQIVSTVTTSADSEATNSAETDNQVTIVEFSDLQCPACKATAPIVKQVLDSYGNKVRLVYRHFPLESIHKNARAAAIAAEAAGMQEMFWEYHDLLFETQDDWAESANPQPQFEEYAQSLGLDMEKFVADREASDLAQKVDKDIQDGMALGINSTPTFFVDNELVSSRDLTAAIDAKLTQ